MPPRAPRVRRHLLVVLLALLGPATRVDAQDVTEVTLKGAFLFNFARFTEWPAETFHADSTVSACVLGDRDIADALSRTVAGKQVSGRSVAVTLVAPDAPLPACHVLYLSSVVERRIDDILSTVRELPVLTVSDADAFAQRGGIVQMFVEDGKMKFRVNARSAKRARLALSSRLLALAELVDDDVASIATEPLTKPVSATGAGLASQ
jgi:YfiR/HmsC-like